MCVVLVVPHKDPEARRAYRRQYYLSKQQEFIEYARQQRAERGEEINAQRRARYAQRPAEWHEAYLEYQRKWYADRPGYARDQRRRWVAANPEEASRYQLAWQRANREYMVAYTAWRRGRAGAGMTRQDKKESIEWRRLIADDPCFYCGTATAEAYEDDHYVSIANGGTDHWWNLVRACQPCNRAKLAMNGDEFLALLQAA